MQFFSQLAFAKIYCLMKLYITLISALIIVFSANAQTKKAPQKTPVKTQKQVNFYESDYVKFSEMLLDSGKPGVIYLYFKAHRPSEQMTSIFEQKHIVEMIDSHYYAYRANVREDVELALKYGIQDVPCIILIDKSHREYDRLYGLKSAEEVERFLRQLAQ